MISSLRADNPQHCAAPRMTRIGPVAAIVMHHHDLLDVAADVHKYPLNSATPSLTEPVIALSSHDWAPQEFTCSSMPYGPGPKTHNSWRFPHRRPGERASGRSTVHGPHFASEAEALPSSGVIRRRRPVETSRTSSQLTPTSRRVTMTTRNLPSGENERPSTRLGEKSTITVGLPQSLEMRTVWSSTVVESRSPISEAAKCLPSRPRAKVSSCGPNGDINGRGERPSA